MCYNSFINNGSEEEFGTEKIMHNTRISAAKVFEKPVTSINICRRYLLFMGLIYHKNLKRLAANVV